ncbi:MAG: VOC family protein [Proteobacteria bacterium]|nr:VOC family protein [Pseudomonadota bacterium]
MDIAIYVTNDKDLNAGNSLIGSFSSQDESLKVVNLMDASVEGVPAEVVQAMLSKKEDTFPLTAVGDKPVVYGRLPTADDLERIIHDLATAPGVGFETPSRVHISLDVNNFERSLSFYRVLFNTEPVKLKKDYAQFILSDPPVNLVLNYFGRKVDVKDAPTNHFGIQVKSSERISDVKARYEKHGFHVVEEGDVACCYSLQTKVWVADPDGNKWEVYIAEAESDHGCGDDCICWEQIDPSWEKSEVS